MRADESDILAIGQIVGETSPRAVDELFPTVYSQLRRIAQRQMGNRAGTLQATALVNEAYLRLLDETGSKWQDRAYFFATAAQAMRRIIAERHRRAARPKHGGGRPRMDLIDEIGGSEDSAFDFLALDRALEGLRQLDQRSFGVFMLRTFGGLSVAETAEILQVSERTVKREHSYAKSWLANQVEKSP